MFEVERDPSKVELGLFIAYPSQTVWRALSEPKSHARWLSPTAGFVPVLGAAFTVQVASVSRPDFELHCHVLEVEPVRRLAYSLVDMRLTPPLRAVVDWQLEQQGKGTRVLLGISGFDIQDRRQKMSRNWFERTWSRTVLPKLAEEVERLGTPPQT